MGRLERKHLLGTDDLDGSAQINISPLVDMVFLLLIFFMVTSVFTRNTALDVTLPQAESGAAASSMSIALSIHADGRITYNGEDLPLSKVREVVSGILQSGDRPVIVYADQDCPTGLSVRLLDQCRLAGAKTVAIAAQGGNAPSH